MSEQWQIVLVGLFASCIGALVVGLATIAWYKFQQFDALKDDLADKATEHEHRVTRLESKLEELDKKAEKWFVLAGTTALHSPDNHLGADPEIERFVTLYRRHNHDMPEETGSDWAFWRLFFSGLMKRENATPNERALAEGFKELCEHKLTRAGLLEQTLWEQRFAAGENKPKEKGSL